MSTHSSIAAEANKSAESLEQEIDQQRAHIDSLIDELELRLKPQHLLDQAMAYGRESGGLEMVERLGQTLKANPIPVALTAVGLAWLAVEQTRKREPGQPCATAPYVADDHESLAQTLEQASRSLQQGSLTARHQLEELAARAESLSSSVKKGAGQVEQALQKNPWAFAAAGLAIGALAGLFSRSRDSEAYQPGDSYDLADTDEEEKPPFHPGAV